MLTLSVPRRLSHIWIGPLAPPLEWMQTWRDHHPEWDYCLYDNDYLAKNQFRTRLQMDEYAKRGNFAGVADLMRYEILYEKGGFIAAADSVCLKNTDPLFVVGDAFTVYENEFLRGKLVSPILACQPGNAFVEILIDTLANTDPQILEDPWRSTGNKFVAEMIERYEPIITIFPSHTMIPTHFEGRNYTGNDTVYAKQLFGSTRSIYQRQSKTLVEKLKAKIKRKRQKKYRTEALLRANRLRGDLFHTDP